MQASNKTMLSRREIWTTKKCLKLFGEGNREAIQKLRK